MIISLILTSFLFAADFPDQWWKEVPKSEIQWWEISPHMAKKGKEVILSKRNELGVLSNFSHTPFKFEGKKYESIEGFWQMMLFPEDKSDPRMNKKVKWEHTRGSVSQMIAFEAKLAGEAAEKNMHILGIDWVTFNAKKFPYRSMTPGRHYELIVGAMRAKMKQNKKVQEILKATKNLKLLPDHHPEKDSPPEWKYFEVWEKLRSEL